MFFFNGATVDLAFFSTQYRCYGLMDLTVWDVHNLVGLSSELVMFQSEKKKARTET